MHTVAVSYLEWIRWVATGWFRCADRVVWVEGADDQSGINALFDRTPDLQVADDQGYVIARLRAGSLMSRRILSRERPLAHLWLDVAAVASFHPLSIRGARLLEADAERAAVRLGEPLFEKAWADWRDRRLEDEAHWRGFSLCAAFGLEYPVLENIGPQVSDILAGRKAAPNSSKAREDAIEGTRAFGWASAMSIAVIDLDVREAFLKTPEYQQIKSLIKARRSDLDLGRPLLDDERSITAIRSAEGVLRKLGVQVLPLEVMATVLHYRSLATGGRKVTLYALIEDLAAIALEDPNHASLAAYFIGRSMENVAVTTLLYQSQPSRYSALAPSVEQKQLSVMTLAARRIEAKQSVDEDRKANPGGEPDVNAAKRNHAATGVSTEGARAEQQVGDQKIVRDGSISLPDESSIGADTPPAPMGESNVAELATNPNVGAVKPGSYVNPTSSEGESEKINQAEKAGAELMTGSSQSALDGREQVVASTKGKKNRKKTDKTLEDGSAADTSEDASDK